MAQDTTKIEGLDELQAGDRIAVERYMQEKGCTVEEALAYFQESEAEESDTTSDADIIAKYGVLSDEELSEIDAICERVKNGETFED